jgi:hypothetical protein
MESAETRKPTRGGKSINRKGQGLRRKARGEKTSLFLSLARDSSSPGPERECRGCLFHRSANLERKLQDREAEGVVMQETERTKLAPLPRISNWEELAGKCPRCKGTMIEQKFYGPGEPFWGWRCVPCGEILDPLIWENRHLTRGLQIPNRVGRQNGRERRR